MAANLQPITSDGGFTSGGNINSSGDPSAAPSLNDFFSITSAANFAIVTDNANTDQTWTFGTDGSLTLPIGVSIDNSVDPLYPKIIADSNLLFSVQGQGNTGSAALAWTIDPNAASQYAAVAVTRAGGDDLAKVILTAQANSGDSANAKVWTFNEAGNLTLPGNTFAVNYANGTQVSIGGGGNTGNVTFDDINVIGTGNLHLQPDPANASDYLDIYLTGAADIHIASSGNVILGTDEEANVAVLQGGNVAIQAGNVSGTQTWNFGTDGTTTFPTANVDLHNGGVQSGEVLQFGNPNLQSIITGPTPSANVSAQRIIIQGQRGNGTGEGGDVYVWGGDADTNGGDIKIYAGNADNVSAGTGGYVNIDGGDGFDQGGAVTIDGGISANGPGGQVSMTGGSGELNGGYASLQGGFSANGQGGVVQIAGGGGNSQAAYGNVEIGSGTYTWLFDNTGNVRLPGNTFAVNYANGTQVSISGGNANTGNVTFSDQIVIGTGSNDGTDGLYLAPGNNSIANSALQYLRVRGGDVVTHIHLDTGNNAFYDQYFGNDAKYVKLEAGDAGNVVIGTDDANGNQYSWSFTSDGNLILAGGNSVIQSIANSSSEPLYPNVSTMVFTPDALLSSQSLVLDPTGPSHIHLRAPGANIDEPDANIFLGGEASSFEVGYYNGNVPNLYIHSNNNTWTFDTTGILVFPRDTDPNVADPILNIIGGANPTITSTDASLAGPANLGISALTTIFTGFTGDAIKIYPDDGEISSTANLQIWANSGGNTEYSWTFDTTGNLTTPSNLVIGPGPGSGSSIFQYNEGLQILGEGANSVVQMGWTANTIAPDSVTTIAMNYPSGGEGNILIAVGNNATTVNYWLFDNTGNLRLPGNTFAVNYANGTQVSLGGGNVTWAQIEDKDGNSGPTIITLGQNAGLDGQGNAAIAIGKNAGQGGQGDSSITIGEDAGGNTTQGANAVAIGRSAGFDAQGEYAVAIGHNAGYAFQGLQTVAVGLNAGSNTQSNLAVAIGTSAGSNTQGDAAVAIGATAGFDAQGNQAVAIGTSAGENSQGAYAVAIGSSAGSNTQGGSAVALGTSAGENSQGVYSVAIGYAAAQINQGTSAVAVGLYAGQTNQANNSIVLNATGAALNQTVANTFTVAPVRNDVSNIAEVMFYNATSKEVTYGNTISIAGNANVGNLNTTTAIITTGNITTINSGLLQNGNSNITLTANGNVSIQSAGSNVELVVTSTGVNVSGNLSVTGNTNAGDLTASSMNLTSSQIALGLQAGLTSQGANAISIGRNAGSNTQAAQSIAIGQNAGTLSQGAQSIAIGVAAGGNSQGQGSIAMGRVSGQINQGNFSIAIGESAANNSQGDYAIALGAFAGNSNQANNSIVINATVGNLENTTANSLVIAPVRNDTSNIAEVMFYNATSKEVTYGNTISIAGNVTGGNISTAGNISGNTNGFTIGYLNIPQVSAANATLALTDAGKHYYSTTAGNLTLTIPTNANVAFATGTAVSIVVQAAGNILVNAASGVTLYMAGNSTAANRVVGGYGMATLMKVASDTWFINGAGVA